MKSGNPDRIGKIDKKNCTSREAANALPLGSRPERLRSTVTAQSAISRPAICTRHYCQASPSDVSAEKITITIRSKNTKKEKK